MASFIPYFVALALAISAGAADNLQCYSCNSMNRPNCKWGQTSRTFKTESCKSAGFLNRLVGAKCYKITAKIKNGLEYTARGCLNPPAKGCNTIAKTIGWVAAKSSSESYSIRDINCQTCNTDKCNSASKLAGFTLLGVLLATFAFLF